MHYRSVITILFLVILLGLYPGISFQYENNLLISSAGAIQNPAPTPTIDRLALPRLPEDPTQVELGNSLYYYNCMPCHGDRGQGLTDEWREVWEEDHQDCWASGCHGLRNQEGVFRIPTTIPPVAGSVDIQSQYSNPYVLFEYLRSTHPPQSPGKLKDGEYWALTAYLLSQNGIIRPQDEVGPQAKIHFWKWFMVISGCVIGITSVVLLITLKRRDAHRKNLINL